MKVKRLVAIAAVSLSAFGPAVSSAQSIVNPGTALTVWGVLVVGVIASQPKPPSGT